MKEEIVNPGQAGESAPKGGKPPIGGLRTQSKYKTFGTSGQPGRSDVQMPGSSDAQTLGSLDVQTSERSDSQTPGKKKRRRRTIYLDLDVDKRLRERIADSEEEMSGLVNEALRAFMSR